LAGVYKCDKKVKLKRSKKKPSASTDIAGSLTSSIKYNSLKEGKAININIKAGVIVHTNSMRVNRPRFLIYWGLRSKQAPFEFYNIAAF